jgi:hypothetical protein
MATKNASAGGGRAHRPIYLIFLGASVFDGPKIAEGGCFAEAAEAAFGPDIGTHRRSRAVMSWRRVAPRDLAVRYRYAMHVFDLLVEHRDFWDQGGDNIDNEQGRYIVNAVNECLLKHEACFRAAARRAGRNITRALRGARAQHAQSLKLYGAELPPCTPQACKGRCPLTGMEAK